MKLNTLQCWSKQWPQALWCLLKKSVKCFWKDAVESKLSFFCVIESIQISFLENHNSVKWEKYIQTDIEFHSWMGKCKLHIRRQWKTRWYCMSRKTFYLEFITPEMQDSFFVLKNACEKNATCPLGYLVQVNQRILSLEEQGI